jgi:two-component system, OmpR family, sensor kinase
MDDTALQQTSAQPGETALYSTILKNDVEWRVLTQTLNIWGRKIGVQVATSSQTVKEATHMLVNIMLASGGIGILGSIGLGMWLSHRALKPIKDLTDAAGRIADTDDLKTRLLWTGPMDELGRLVSVFNRMMTRLEHLFSVQQRFVADVSHELRTPLTAIRGNLDIIKRYGMDKDSFDAIESEVERMSRMVSDLLLLARADYGGLTLELEPLDVDTVVTEVYKEARVLAKDRNLAVAIHDFEPVRIKGNADRIKQLLLNLIGNALKFTSDGGRITLNLRRENNFAVLQVQDSGIGISREDQERIFDRFFQADSSRVRQPGEGSGLGLSIAKWIADAHQGTISVESEPGKGSTFTVRIPTLDQNTTASSHAITRRSLGIIRRNHPPTPEKVH